MYPSKKDIAKFVNGNVLVNNSGFIVQILKMVRRIKIDQLEEKITIFPSELFKKVSWSDLTISRVVGRYQDIMICIEFYENFGESKISGDIGNLKKIIRDVARKDDLDRVIYLRIFRKGLLGLENSWLWQKGYADSYHEFNEDILDIISVSLESIDKHMEDDEKLDDWELLFEPLWKNKNQESK